MNARAAQFVAAGLSLLLIILVGAVVFILLSSQNQRPRPTATPTATSAAVVTPSLAPTPTAIPTPTLAPTPTPSPSPSPSPSPTPLPTDTPLITAPPITPSPTPELTPSPTIEITPSPTIEITPSPTVELTPSPTPEITPSPTPEETIAPTSPERQIRVPGLGLDGRDVGVERYLLFGVDGQSIIRATLSNASARSQICLWRGNNVTARTCQTMRNGTLEVEVPNEDHTNWTLSLIGANADTGPVVDLDLAWNGEDGQVTFENLRYEGQPRVNYNGVTVEVTALGDGDIQVNGQFEGQQQHGYRVLVERLGAAGAVVIDETGGPVNEFEVTGDVTTGTTYRTTVSNPNPEQEPGPVFIEVVVAWP